MGQEHIPQPLPRDAVQEKLENIRIVVAENAPRVAEVGKWPAHIQPKSLVERIPKAVHEKAPGFDAGVACALDAIPRDKQGLAATLHANYSKDAVLQIRQEMQQSAPDTATAWWLAACTVCKEGEIDGAAFLQQLEDFKRLANDTEARGKAAEQEFAHMTHSFTLKDGVPYGERDGCIQGAYIAGYPYGTMYAAKYGLYFIGTYEDSLGLEDFPWSQEKDEKGRQKSGPVFGSKQFVKCATEDEWRRAMEVVKNKLPLPTTEEKA